MAIRLLDIDEVDPIPLISLERAVRQYRAESGAAQFPYERYRTIAQPRGYVAFPSV